MQVYRGMDIGTAKTSPQVRREVPHHMIDVCDPEVDMSVAEFQRAGRRALADLEERGVVPVICGGSGLHFRSLVDPLRFPPNDPDLRAELDGLQPQVVRERLLALDADASRWVDLDNPRRVVRALEIALLTGRTPSVRAQSREATAVRNYVSQIDFVAIGLDPGPELPDRVETRFDGMLGEGLLGEVETLRPRLGRLASQAVGYRQLIPVADGDIDLEAGRSDAITATRSLAKRQRTFFRRDPRIVWLPWHTAAEQRAAAAIEELNRRLSESVTWIL